MTAPELAAKLLGVAFGSVEEAGRHLSQPEMDDFCSVVENALHSASHQGGKLVHSHCQHPVARIASLVAKCDDRCGIDLDGVEASEGYVPHGWGVGGGDYVEFRWCLDCGTIVSQDWPANP